MTLVKRFENYREIDFKGRGLPIIYYGRPLFPLSEAEAIARALVKRFDECDDE